MIFSAWFKSKTADKVLTPVRETLLDQFTENSSVLEIGCGTGDLLFKAAGKISQGVGIDLNPAMIEFANKRKQQNGIDNIDFYCVNALDFVAQVKQPFDTITMTLCLHEMRYDDAAILLQQAASMTKQFLIVDYTSADSKLARLGIELDEMISGHYHRFRQYRQKGEIPGLAKQSNLQLSKQMPTTLDGLHLWKLSTTLGD